MSLKEALINTALLGTDKKLVVAADMPEALRPEVEKILSDKADNDIKFLKISALALGFHRAGVQPAKMDLKVNMAEPETLPYCTDSAVSLLKQLLEENYTRLIEYWTGRCADKNLIVQPQILPLYFGWGSQHKETRADFVKVVGNRGAWLSKFSPDWEFNHPERQKQKEEEFDWDMAVIDARVAYLKKLRLTEPALALEKIKTAWPQENAANRTDLISSLRVNLSKADEEFITACFNEKSVKVKELALQLLKQIPDSAITQSYKKILIDSIQIKQNKILGIVAKTDVKVNLKLDDESVYKTGIEHLSNNKKISDDTYTLMQLIAEVPPSFWVEQYQMSITDLVKVFDDKGDLKKFMPYLIQAVTKFNEAGWAKAILDTQDELAIGLLGILNESDRRNYADKFVKEYTDDVIRAMSTSDGKEWDMAFVKQLVPLWADNPSRYDKNYYERIITYLPVQMVNELDKVTLTEDWKKNYWPGIVDEIKKLISLKEQIKTAFT